MGTPFDLRRGLSMRKPVVRLNLEDQELAGPTFEETLQGLW